MTDGRTDICDCRVAFVTEKVVMMMLVVMVFMIPDGQTDNQT